MTVKDEALIRQFAAVHLPESARQFIQHNCESYDDWPKLFNLAEQFGLAPLLYHHIKQLSISVPENDLRVLKTLVVRHQLNWRSLETALDEIVHLFNEAGIEFLLLKGAALVHIIYPDPTLRPMCDLDIMIRPEQGKKAQALLWENGFSGEEQYEKHLSGHHHLPGLIKQINRIPAMVELHTQALSDDARLPITWNHLAEPTRVVTTDYGDCRTLGHIDTLMLLYQHTFSRVEKIRLVGVVDMVEYASRYFDEIDWPRIERQYPVLLNAFRCLHPLVPMPDKLSELAPPPAQAMDGIGLGMLPLRDILQKRNPFGDIIHKLFFPSPWWLHVFYGVAPERSLIGVKLFRHPYRVFRWLIRRVFNRIAD